jgi:site-specific recombinase XerD
MQLDKFKKRQMQTISESTLETRLSQLRKFERFIGEDREPMVEDVEDYAEHLIEEYNKGEFKSGTVRQYMKAVRYYYEVMWGEGDKIGHIFKWLPKEENDHGDYLTQEEWEQVKRAAIKPREKAMISLMYKYSRRPGEVRLLNMEDLDMDEGTITFNILKKDSNLRATFELFDDVRRDLNRYLRIRKDITIEAEKEWEEGMVSPLFSTGQGRMSYETMRKDMQSIIERAGIGKNITPGSMRHSRATHLDWDGKTPEAIARHMLVHEPGTDVISAYIHDRDEQQVRKPMEVGGEE